MSLAKLIGGRKTGSFDPISDLAGKIGQISASRSFNDEKIGQIALATESLGSTEEQLLSNVYNGVESTIKSIVQDFNLSLENHNLEAAAIAGIFATNPKAFLATKLKSAPSDSVIMPSGVSDGFMERPQVSLEAYDERENRNAQMFSIVYNLLSSRQDEFGETFFPTIIVNPSEVGVHIAIRLFYVYNDFKRSASGALANYARKNVIRAYADPEILKNEQTRVIPVLRTGGGADDNSALFASEVPTWSVELGSSITVTTGALRVDSKIDLIGVSQTNELLNSGLMGPSDSLDTYIKLTNIYVKITEDNTTEVIRVNTEHIPAAVFTYAPQGNYRRMILTMDSDGVVFDNKTLTVAGTAPTLLPELATHKARVQLTINGSVVIDKGDANVSRGSLSLVALRNASDQLVTGTVFSGLAAKLASLEVIGYTLEAFRANSNIRQRGQLLDTQIENRILPVPYRSPMSVIMPAILGSEDTSALQNLITATGIRVSNEAVGSLLKAQATLAAYTPVAIASGELPELSSIGHFYVKPVYFTEQMSLALTVDSLKSHERIKDIRAAIVEKIRFYANEMYRQSEYKAAAAVLTGNIGFKPTVIVGTDPVLFNYIQSDGDLRTLGEAFDVKVVSTLDERVAGKIFISFSCFDGSRNTAVNPLSFGCMLYSPEVTTKMPVSRDGQVSNELIVIPRFTHVPVLPVLTVLDVSGLPQVATAKVNVHTRDIV